MKKIGIFYGSSTGNTELVADKIQTIFGEENADVHNIDSIDIEDINHYSNLIFGTSTWGLGNLQDDWEDFENSLKKVDFTNKKVALYGLGDQEVYADSFVNGMGKLYKLISKKVTVVGSWPIDGYRFHNSEAVQNNAFVGLAIDYDNEPKLMDEQIIKWVEQLKKEF
jgi:flavodoxin I